MSTTSTSQHESERDDSGKEGSLNIEAQMASPSGSGIFQLTPETLKALEAAKAEAAAKSTRASNDGRELLKHPFDSWS